jgi:hypothetical protein
MKPLPAPSVPGKTEFERFDNAMRRVLTVSKEELLRREAREQRKVAAEQRETAAQMRSKRRPKKQ